VLGDELDAQRAFGAVRLRDTVANDDDLGDIDSFVDFDVDSDAAASRGAVQNDARTPRTLLLVTGARGGGKSTLLVRWCEARWQLMSAADETQKCFLHVHHLGCSPAGTAVHCLSLRNALHARAGSSLTLVVRLLARHVAAACHIDLTSFIVDSTAVDGVSLPR
jgi:hypothetical protein